MRVQWALLAWKNQEGEKRVLFTFLDYVVGQCVYNLYLYMMMVSM